MQPTARMADESISINVISFYLVCGLHTRPHRIVPATPPARMWMKSLSIGHHFIKNHFCLVYYLSKSLLESMI